MALCCSCGPGTDPFSSTLYISNSVIYPLWHDNIACITSSSYTSVIYPLWHNNIFNVTSTPFTNNNTITYPVWHDNIIIPMPSIIQERTEAKSARLEQYHLEDAERQEKVRREVAEAEEKRKIAAERAKKFLMEHLTPEQRETIEKNDWFIIEGGKTKKRYRINRRGIAGNVEELDGEKVVAKYCCHIAHHYPRPDHHLAQKLMLEWDEEEFLQRANKTSVR